jgi:hypothetical protein
MALAYIGPLSALGGTSNASGSNVAGASFAVTLNAAAAAGSVVVLTIAKDIVGTTDAETSEVTGITDSVGGNTWTKRKEYRNGQGSAAAGGVVAVWTSVLVNGLGIGDTITASFSSSITAKAIQPLNFSIGVGSILGLEDSDTLAADGAVPGSMTLSGLPSREYLFFRGVGGEAGSAMTATASYTAEGGAKSGTGTSNINARSEFRIVTATSGTSNPTSYSADSASVFLALYEIAPSTAALTGQAATTAAGTLAPSTDKALTGEAVTAAQGAATPTITVALTGLALTAALDAITPTSGTVEPLTGVAAATAVGDAAPTVTVALTGLELASALGAATALIEPLADGQEMTVFTGTLAKTADTALTGVQLDAALGTVTGLEGYGADLVGEGLATSLGTTGQTITVALTGLQIGVEQGAMAPAATLAVSGQQAQVSQGVLGVVIAVTAQGEYLVLSEGEVRAALYDSMEQGVYAAFKVPIEISEFLVSPDTAVFTVLVDSAAFPVPVDTTKMEVSR